MGLKESLIVNILPTTNLKPSIYTIEYIKPFIAATSLETILSNNITVYSTNKIKIKLSSLVVDFTKI